MQSITFLLLLSLKHNIIICYSDVIYWLLSIYQNCIYCSIWHISFVYYFNDFISNKNNFIIS